MITEPYALVIEDDPIFQKAMNLILREFGFQPVITDSPELFLQKARSLGPGLVLVDLNIGSKFIGFKLIEKFRKEISNFTPLIVMTGTEDPRVIAQALEIGATDYLLKSIDKSYLGLKLLGYVKTEKLTEMADKDVSILQEQRAVHVVLSFQIHSIDELGVTFVSPHLFPTGVSVKISGNFFDEIFGIDAKISVYIASSIVEASSRTYITYAEFDASQVAVMTAVRIWLKMQDSKKLPVEKAVS